MFAQYLIRDKLLQLDYIIATTNIPTAPRRPVNIPIVVVCAAPEADPDDAGDDADADDDAEPVEFVQLTFDGTVAVLESVTSEHCIRHIMIS